jgi:alpha-beta hydrolase superfamily lysophospholipase
MNHFEGMFKGVRDLNVFYQTLLPEGEIKAAILIVHGLGEHSGRYLNVADYLVPRGYAIYGFDLIGHGKSAGERAYVERYEDYSETLLTYYKMVKAEQPELPIFLLGHSMGGLIVTEYLIDHSAYFQGAIISAPSIMIPDFVTKFTVIAGKVLSKIAPKIGLFGLDANAVSRDPEVVQAYVNDPLVFHGKTTARLSAESLQAIMRVNEDMEQITAPLIILHGEDDKLANPKASELLYDRASSIDKTLKIYEGLYHEVFNEPEREQVLGDVATWLEAHIS